MSVTPVLEAFTRALDPEHEVDADAPELEAALARCIERARATWSSLELSDADFAAWVGARLPEGANTTVLLDELRAEDLYLACACAQGNARAIAALDEHHGPALRRTLGRVSSAHLEIDDLEQIVRNRMLVGNEQAPPVITQYSGQGSLSSWVRVVGMRTALNATRRKQPRLGERHDVADELDGVVEGLDDPELGYLREHYQVQFREAFAEAAQTLDSRQRNLLRQSAIHGLGVRDLGRMYGVHYATASRWLAQARQALITGTREGLAGRLHVGEGELQSIMRLIQSDFDMTLGRVLKTMS